jgi:hypothetical protein
LVVEEFVADVLHVLMDLLLSQLIPDLFGLGGVLRD